MNIDADSSFYDENLAFPHLLKSKVQVGVGKDSNGQQHLSASRVALNIFKESGFKGFYQGFTPCIIRAFPSSAALFLVFEYSKKWLEDMVDGGA